MTTVLYYFYPELFRKSKKNIHITEENLKTGYLEENVSGKELYFGEIKEKEEVKRKMLEAFA